MVNRSIDCPGCKKPDLYWIPDFVMMKKVPIYTLLCHQCNKKFPFEGPFLDSSPGQNVVYKREPVTKADFDDKPARVLMPASTGALLPLDVKVEKDRGRKKFVQSGKTVLEQWMAPDVRIGPASMMRRRIKR